MKTEQITNHDNTIGNNIQNKTGNILPKTSNH